MTLVYSCGQSEMESVGQYSKQNSLIHLTLLIILETTSVHFLGLKQDMNVYLLLKCQTLHLSSTKPN